MVDIETLGMNPIEHPMIQLGAVVFDPLTFDPTDHEPFTVNIAVPETKRIDLGTLEWWLRTDPEALQLLLKENGRPLDAMSAFVRWLPAGNCYLWAKPVTFDTVFIFHYLKEFLYLPAELHYRKVIDVRSYLRGRGWVQPLPEVTPKFEGKAHNALYDCYEQIEVLKRVDEILIDRALDVTNG